MIPLLLYILILVLVLGLVWYVVTTLLPIPPQFLRVAQVVIVVLFVVLLLSLLFGLVPGTGFYAPRL